MGLSFALMFAAGGAAAGQHDAGRGAPGPADERLRTLTRRVGGAPGGTGAARCIIHRPLSAEPCRWCLQLGSRAGWCAAAANWPAAELLLVQASTEPWFDIPYVEAPIPAMLLDGWAAPKGGGGDLALPQRNEFIATDFSLRCEDGGDGAAAQSNGAACVERGSANGSAKVCFRVGLCMFVCACAEAMMLRAVCIRWEAAPEGTELVA